MTASDPWDDDDALFQDATTLDLLEAQAIQSSQVPKPRQTQRYHHTVAQPKAGPSKPLKFSGRKEPAPLNTEPRAGVGGFGWEHGGKRSMEGNVERHIQMINDRQAYWSHGNADQQKNVNNQEVFGEEEEYPDVVMKEDGGYAFEPEAEVVDNRGQAAIQESQARQTQAAAARRAAIIQQANKDVSTTSREKSLPPDPPPRFPVANRTLSRSISAGHHPIARPTSRGPGPGLSPIPSQSEMQLPPSQGTLARKAALELDDERHRREQLEAELRRLKADLSKQRLQFEELREKNELEEDSKEAMVGRANETVAGKSIDEVEKRIQAMQNELWKARGEAEIMRRAQKDEQARHVAEADKLRAKISDMENKLRERERDAARQVENVKTQAVFANHAAHNSAIKARAASQRPMPTPLRGSPRGKGQEESFLLRTGQKGKGKALPPPPPAPRFEALNNAFSTTPTVSRVKRQRTESVFPAQSPSPTRASPKPSPRKGSMEGEAGPSSPSPFVEDVVMDEDQAASLGVEAEPLLEPDLKGELLYHIFNYSPISPFQQTLDKNTILQPTIYRLLHYRPPALLDKDEIYGRLCGDLLRACGDSNLVHEGLLEVLAEVGMGMLRLLIPALDLPNVTNYELAAIINILDLFAKTAWMFTRFIPILCGLSPSPTSLLQGIVNCLYISEKAIVDIQHLLDANSSPKLTSTVDLTTVRPGGVIKRSSPPPPLDPRRTRWVEELARGCGELTQTICWFAGGLDVWSGQELVDIALGLTSSHLDAEIVAHGVVVIWTASTFKENFRPLMTQTSKSEETQPVIDRICRYLINPPVIPPGTLIYDITLLLLRALAMLSIADRDAILLVGQRSAVVPALILLLRRESNKIWGVWIDDFDLKRTLSIITIALTVLHHLIYPHPIIQTSAPLTSNSNAHSASQRQRQDVGIPDYALAGPDPPLPQSQAPASQQQQQPVNGDSNVNGNGGEVSSGLGLQGINFVERIRELGSTREFHGIGHQFMSCLGMMSYGQPVCEDAEEIEKIDGVDLNLIQEMSQDVLEALVEGPEEEAVYELYADDEDEDGGNGPDADDGDHAMEEEQDEQVDKDVYNAILVEDDSD